MMLSSMYFFMSYKDTLSPGGPKQEGGRQQRQYNPKPTLYKLGKQRPVQGSLDRGVTEPPGRPRSLDSKPGVFQFPDVGSKH
jgi:hypothetical protein